MSYQHQFVIEEDGGNQLRGVLTLQESKGRGVQHREAKLELENERSLEIVFTHGPASAQIIYLSKRQITPNYAKVLGLKKPEKYLGKQVTLPGQLILGAERAHLFREAVDDCFRHPGLEDDITNAGQGNVVLIPVLREGIKYGIIKTLNDRFDFYIDEIVADAYHVEDTGGNIYRRGVSTVMFKDDDVLDATRQGVETAIVADSFASGQVLLGLFDTVVERLPSVKRLELIAPLASLHGLARIAAHAPAQLRIRVSILETVLDTLPPDHYWSAHFEAPEMHIQPSLQEDYVKWWGNDDHGNSIAATACAGYGWSEAFFNPRSQMEIINSELKRRHGLTVADIIERNSR